MKAIITDKQNRVFTFTLIEGSKVKIQYNNEEIGFKPFFGYTVETYRELIATLYDLWCFICVLWCFC